MATYLLVLLVIALSIAVIIGLAAMSMRFLFPKDDLRREKLASVARRAPDTAFKVVSKLSNLGFWLLIAIVVFMALNGVGT